MRLLLLLDTCTIMYTSGSTGAPKGVILSHKNICASVAAVHFLLVHILQPADVYIGELRSAYCRSIAKRAKLTISLHHHTAYLPLARECLLRSSSTFHFY